MLISLTFVCLAFCYGTPTAAEGTSCPDGWVAFSGICYLFGPHPLDFSDAKVYCGDHSSSKLIRLDSDVENDFIQDQLRRYKDQQWWLGMQFELGQWKWSAERVNYSTPVNSPSWTITTPLHNGYDCAYFNHNANYAWSNGDCLSKRTPICQLYR